MSPFKQTFGAIAIAFGVLSTAGVPTYASAQSAQSAQPAQQQANISDTQLREFANARSAVEQIQMKYQDKAQNVTSEQDMQRLQAQANNEMVQAVEKTNLSVEQYNQIASLIQTDQKMLDRYMKLAR